VGLATWRMTLDFDSTPVEVESAHNDQADPNRKHGYGFHPLLVYLDQTGEALGGVPPPRPGSCRPPPQSAADRSMVRVAACGHSAIRAAEFDELVSGILPDPGGERLQCAHSGVELA
jgi:hypothetical protein